MDYTPFGGKYWKSDLATATPRLNWIGKETDYETGLGDHGVRKYTYQNGRFNSIDPLWEKYYSWSPCQYAGNNPISIIDPSGLAWDVFVDAGFLIYDVYDIAETYAQGDKPTYEQWESLRWDALATVTPFMLGGKGMARARHMDDAVDLYRSFDVVNDLGKTSRSIPKFRKFTKNNFSTNLKRLTGGKPSANAQAHHVFPQKFKSKFDDMGLNINDPRYGTWWDTPNHQKYAKEYNKAWEEFFENSSIINKESILEYGKEVMCSFGRRVNY